MTDRPLSQIGGKGLFTKEIEEALLSGAIDATLPNVSEAGEQVRDGSFRALAVMAKKRLKDFPNVPTTYENGYEVATSTTRGYWVLKGTPKDRVETTVSVTALPR